MIEQLLPTAVVAVEARADLPDEPPFPGEEEMIAKAVDSRRREFITARRCAREALGKLGHPPAAIGRGERREPLWPAGVVGSITHCAGYRAAAVAPAAEVASVGIDAEPYGPLPDGVLRVVTAEGDADHLAELTRRAPDTRWDQVLFSAKESVYKAWYPLTGRWLGFEDASLTFDPAAATFSARLHVPGWRTDGGPELTRLEGRYAVADGLLITAVTVHDGLR